MLAHYNQWCSGTKLSRTYILKEDEAIKLVRIFAVINGNYIQTEGKWTMQSVKDAAKINMKAYNLKQVIIMPLHQKSYVHHIESHTSYKKAKMITSWAIACAGAEIVTHKLRHQVTQHLSAWVCITWKHISTYKLSVNWSRDHQWQWCTEYYVTYFLVYWE